MRTMTSQEKRALADAKEAIFAGVIASQKLEGVEVSEDMEVPEVALSPEDEFRLAQNLGIISR